MRGGRDNVRSFRIPGIMKHGGEKLHTLSVKRPEGWVKVLKCGELSEAMLKNGLICSKHFITGIPKVFKMDTRERMMHWAKSMGYDCNMPDLKNICHASTSFIWEQVIQNVKPRQEVEICRKNVIISRLKKKTLDDQDDFPYPIRDIENYHRKIKLENEIAVLQNDIDNKELQLDNISRENNAKYLLTENFNQQLKEIDERTYLLSRKSEMVESQIKCAEDMLAEAKNLTPAESSDNPNTKEITETLEKCSEKLEKLISEVPQYSILNSENKFIPSGYNTCQKTTKKHSTAKKIHFTSHKKYQLRNKGSGSSRVARSLYTEKTESACRGDVEIKSKEQMLIVESAFENAQSKSELGYGSDKENKRESLGILPESLLALADDDLLQDINRFRTPVKTLPPSTPALKSLISSDKNIGPDSVFNSPVHVSKEDPYQKVYNDKLVTGNIRELLDKHNRSLLWNSVKSLCNNSLSNTKDSVVQFDSCSNSNIREIDETDIAKLYHAHIKIELDTLKYKLINKDLEQKAEKAKRGTLKMLLSHPLLRDRSSEVQQMFELQVQEVRLDALITCLRREITLARELEVSNDLQITLNKIAHVKQEMLEKLNIIEKHTEESFKVMQSINRTKDVTASSVRRLNSFISDLHWALPLAEHSCSEELRVFSEFPIEFNRRLQFTDPKIFYRDICADNFPSYLNLDSEALRMVSHLLESPFSPPETVILNIIRSKMKLAIMKSLQNLPVDVDCKKYKVEDLRKQESYVDYALDKLRSMLSSSSNDTVLHLASKMKEVTNLWLEAPFKDCMSARRLLNEKPYTYYENLFDNFFDSF